MITYLGTLHLSGESEILNRPYPPNVASVMPKSSTFGIAVSSKLGSVDLEVDLENSGDDSSELMVSLQEIDIRYLHKNVSLPPLPIGTIIYIMT